PEAEEALKIFDTKISPDQLKADSERRADDIEAVWSAIEDIKKIIIRLMMAHFKINIITFGTMLKLGKMLKKI
ncbi:MAG: hypothetical protein IKA03_00495, partial [Alphaproteobacteria bacterium]|nr:hypothetical protein [Alphaproteobacteria bacterium]